MNMIRFVTLLLIFYQYDLVSSDASSPDKVESSTGARISYLVEKMTNVWIDEETRQLNAVHRRLQQHYNFVETTYARQSLQQKVSELK